MGSRLLAEVRLVLIKLYLGHISAWMVLFYLTMLFRLAMASVNRVSFEFNSLLFATIMAVFSTMVHFVFFM